MAQPPQPPYGPPAPPKQGMSTGKKIGLGCGGCLAVLVVLFLFAGCVAVLSSGGSGDSATTREETAQEETAQEEPAEEVAEEAAAEGEEAEETEEAEEPQDVVLTAEAVEYEPGVLDTGGDHTSVYVTVENNGDEDIDVNPLYFEIVADDGTKKNVSLMAGQGQIDAVTLSPGQRAEGTITAEGAFTAASVEFNDSFGLGETYTAEVR